MNDLKALGMFQMHSSNLKSRSQTSLRCFGFLFSFALCLTIGIASSTSAQDNPEGLEFFEKNIRPILVEHCYECHAGSEANGGLRLDNRNHLLAGGDSGPSLQLDQPEKSLLLRAISYSNPELQMPPKQKLAESDIQKFKEWIARGAPDPRVETTEEKTKALQGMSIEEGKRLWSMQPVSSPAVPVVSNQAWIRTPIDAFILAKLESKNLVPAEAADKANLIRRATFDLTGLPPSYDEIQSFLSDDSPHAFSKVVERLLQSPDYGIRWGRHWLDVARYADSNGLDENLAFGTAWRYRDYVVDSFNRDKPFDRFLTEQIAGDLLADASHESKTATGFLVLGAKVLAEPDRDKLFMDTIDEQLDTLGKTFLGLTFGCARCHDHKFDPIKQADYYALAAIFKSTKTFGDTNYGAIKHWNEHILGTAEQLASFKEIDAQIAEKQRLASSYRSEAMNRIRAEARSKGVEYLKAASRCNLDTSLQEVAEFAKPLGLHPRILYHCRRHLEFHRDDPLFQPWHQFVSSGDMAAIENYYRPLFEKSALEWEELKKKNPGATQLDEPILEAARQAINDPSGFLAVPPKPGFAFDEATLQEYFRLSEEARLVESFAPDVPSAMGVSEGTTYKSIPIHIRGSHRNLGGSIERKFPAVLCEISEQPIFPRNQSGRLELARWLSSSNHPLTARVYVNRVWGWHFGSALVRSTENFGVLGDTPSHPELLDWLARRFVEEGWSTKELHRLIMNSSVYQTQSIGPPSNQIDIHDAENRLLSHFPIQRLNAEQLRDSLLAVAGRLDRSLGGKSVPLRNRQFVFDHTSIDHTKYESLRRAIYLPVIRNNLYTLFEQFDFPDPTMPTGHRNTTTVAPQALWMMNSELVLDSANAIAHSVINQSADKENRVKIAYQLVLGRDPLPKEVEMITLFLSQLTANRVDGNASIGTIDELKAWTLVCQNLLASNEFLYLR